MPIIADIRLAFPEFADTAAYPDALVDLYLQQAIRQCDPVHFDLRLDDAQLFLTAHLLTLGARARASAGMGAGLASVGAGSVSLSFASPPSIQGLLDPSLATTLYGQRFLGLARLGGGMRLVVPA